MNLLAPLLRRALRAGKNPDEIIHTFGRLEPEWLAANAAEILRSAPALLKSMLWLLKRQPAERRSAAFRAIAELDPATRALLDERIDAEFEGEEREQIRAALAPGS